MIRRTRGVLAASNGHPQKFTHRADSMVREKQKEMRRQRTLDAAEALIRKTGTTEFSMQTLANKAKLSLATPYNLFGSKSAILYALLNRSLDKIAEGAEQAFAHPQPVQRVLRAAASSAAVFVSVPDFYRPLYRFLLGVGDPIHRPAFMERSLDYWKTALLGFVQHDLLPKEAGCEHLARQLVIQFVGTLDLWVQEELDDTEFKAQISYGTGLLLLGVARSEDRERLLKHLGTLKRKLPRQSPFVRPPKTG
jgi:AcrR family transcriptional regulator